VVGTSTTCSPAATSCRVNNAPGPVAPSTRQRRATDGWAHSRSRPSYGPSASNRRSAITSSLVSSRPRCASACGGRLR
jgi:hypothetical protein